MAKRKTGKTVDLKPKAESIEQGELVELQTLANKFDQTYKEVGINEARKHNMLHQLAGLQEEMKKLQERLESVYGNVDIDVTDGKIKYPENGELDTKD
tara:strand:+ start:11977 stop:12270 length:294 start_codon:yes stop_codon:yes gene_type:complete